MLSGTQNIYLGWLNRLKNWKTCGTLNNVVLQYTVKPTEYSNLYQKILWGLMLKTKFDISRSKETELKKKFNIVVIFLESASFTRRISLEPVGVLAPRSAHAWPSARLLTIISGIFSVHVSEGGYKIVRKFFWSTFSPNQRILSTFCAGPDQYFS